MADAGGLPVTVHRLKTRAPYYEAVVSGAKPFEVRRDDRGFQRGDRVHLAETAYVSVPGVGDEWCATGREAEYEITYVLTGGQFGIEPGYVVLGLDVPRAYPAMRTRSVLRPAMKRTTA